MRPCRHPARLLSTREEESRMKLATVGLALTMIGAVVLSGTAKD
jgi:hypothetical protein